MIMIFIALMLAVASPSFAQNSQSLSPTAVAIPGGEGGIGFDDLNFSKDLHKVLVPAGHTGKLYLIDPATYAMDAVGGFSAGAKFQKGHRVGISSADEGDGFIFASDHGTHQLDAVDIRTGVITATASLADDVDFVRYVRTTHEVWVTEPDAKEKKQLEVFKFTAGKKPALLHVLDIPVTDGPESLTIDGAHQKAYTNLGKNLGVIDLHTHAVVAQWPNGCEKPRGTAVDEERGFIFDSCGEGKTSAFDQSGKQVGQIVTGQGIDLIDYNPRLAHVYVTGSKTATLSVVGVSAKGELSLLGTGQAAMRSHCVAGDDQNNIWACDPLHGQLLRYKDSLPKSS